MKNSDREILKKVVKYCNDVDILMEKYQSDYKKYEWIVVMFPSLSNHPLRYEKKSLGVYSVKSVSFAKP